MVDRRWTREPRRSFGDVAWIEGRIWRPLSKETALVNRCRNDDPSGLTSTSGTIVPVSSPETSVIQRRDEYDET